MLKYGNHMESQQLNLSLENHKKSNYIRYSSPAPGRTIGNSIRPWAELEKLKELENEYENVIFIS